MNDSNIRELTLYSNDDLTLIFELNMNMRERRREGEGAKQNRMRESE